MCVFVCLFVCLYDPPLQSFFTIFIFETGNHYRDPNKLKSHDASLVEGLSTCAVILSLECITCRSYNWRNGFICYQSVKSKWNSASEPWVAFPSSFYTQRSNPFNLTTSGVSKFLLSGKFRKDWDLLVLELKAVCLYCPLHRCLMRTLFKQCFGHSSQDNVLCEKEGLLTQLPEERFISQGRGKHIWGNAVFTLSFGLFS